MQELINDNYIKLEPIKESEDKKVMRKENVELLISLNVDV